MIRYIKNPLKELTPEPLFPDDPITNYEQLCAYLKTDRNQLVIFKNGERSEASNTGVSDTDELLITRVPASGDDQTDGVLLVVAAIAITLFTGGGGGGAAAGLLDAAAMMMLSYGATKLMAVDVEGPAAQDSAFSDVLSQTNQSRYGQPMPVFIGQGRVAADLSSRPYSRLKSQTQTSKYWFTDGRQPPNPEPEFLTRSNELTATYTFGKARATEFTGLKAGDVLLEGTDDVEVKWNDAITDTSILQSFPGQDLGNTNGSTTKSVVLKPRAGSSRLEVFIQYAASATTSRGKTKGHQAILLFEYRNGPQAEWKNAAPLIRYPEIKAIGSSNIVWENRNHDKIKLYGSRGKQWRWVFVLTNLQHYGDDFELRVTHVDPSDGNDRYWASMALDLATAFAPDPTDYSSQVRAQITFKSGTIWSDRIARVTAKFRAKIGGSHSSNPADWFQYFLEQSNFPASMIDLQSINQWRGYCANNNLQYNRVIRVQPVLPDLLMSLAGVGHAKIAPINGKLGVVILDNQTVVREFTLDAQLSDTPMSVSIIKKPEIKGLELAFYDMEAQELKPMRIGSSPYRRIEIPGISIESQAQAEIERTWKEINAIHRIITFAADDSAWDLQRGQKINVHGQPGVFAGMQTCTVLSVTPAENKTTITARAEFFTPAGSAVAIAPVGVNPHRRPTPIFGAVALDATANSFVDDKKGFIQISWRNQLCTGQEVALIDESGARVTQRVLANDVTFSVAMDKSQLFTIELEPITDTSNHFVPSSKVVFSVWFDSGALTDKDDRYSALHEGVIKGLRLVHTDPRAKTLNSGHNEFSGSDVSVDWRPVAGASMYYIRVFDVASGALLSTDRVVNNEYTYTLHKNKLATARLNLPGRAQRHLTITVAVNDTHTNENVSSISVHNYLPRAPHLLVEQNTAPGVTRISIISAHTDPDFVGYLVWQGDNPDFEPSGTTVGSGACVDILSARSSQLVVDVTPGQTKYFKIAGFDDFTDKPELLNVSAAVEVKGIEVVEIPEIQSQLKIGWNDLKLNEGVLNLPDGNPAFTSATKDASEALQKLIVTALAGIEPDQDGNYKGFRADVLSGALIEFGTLIGKHIHAQSIEARHINAQSTWSPFLSSHEMDAHNIWVDRFAHGADGKVLTDDSGAPVLKNDPANPPRKLYSYLDDQLSALNGRFGSLDVAVGGLVHHFSKTWSRRWGNLSYWYYDRGNKTTAEHWGHVAARNITGGQGTGPVSSGLWALTSAHGMSLNRHVKYESKVIEVGRQISKIIATADISGHVQEPEGRTNSKTVRDYYHLLLTFWVDGDSAAHQILGRRKSLLGGEYAHFYSDAKGATEGEAWLYVETQLTDIFVIPGQYLGKINSIYIDIVWSGSRVDYRNLNGIASSSGAYVPRKISINTVNASAVCILNKAAT